MVKRLKDEGSRTQVVFAGAIAGLVSRFVIAPLDVVKVRRQITTSICDPLDAHPPQPRYTGVLNTFATILREEGITALWKGNIPAEALYLCYGGIQFLGYKTTSAYLDSLRVPISPLTPTGKLTPTESSFIAGATAGTVATTSTYPLDLLRTRFAAQGRDRVYSSLWSGIRRIKTEEGLGGFWRGLAAANVQIIPYMGLFFASYEALKVRLGHVDLPFAWMGSGDGTAGILASIFSKTAVYPFDTVRKRLQVQGPSRARLLGRHIPEYTSGVFGTIKLMLKKEGVKGLYRGLSVSLLKAAPTSAVTMWTYERVMFAMTYVESKEL